MVQIETFYNVSRSDIGKINRRLSSLGDIRIIKVMPVNERSWSWDLLIVYEVEEGYNPRKNQGITYKEDKGENNEH